MRWLASIACASLVAGCASPETLCARRSRATQLSQGNDAFNVDIVLVVDSDPATSVHVDRVIDSLALLGDPPCLSRTSPSTPHRCDPDNADDVRMYPPLPSIRVGIVSADLGARGSGIAACETARGDDARMDVRSFDASSALRHGQQALERVTDRDECAAVAAPRFLEFCTDEARCETLDQQPVYTQFRSLDAALRCRARRAARGCPFGQPLEALWRALVLHGAAEPIESAKPNAGFLRRDAMLSIVVLSTNEDHSARDCAEDHGFSLAHGDGPCVDGTSAFRPDATQWATSDVDLRFYRSTPNSADDPTWNLDRYLDPTGRWPRDLRSLKPGEPWMVRFSAIVGAPPQQRPPENSAQWDSLLASLPTEVDPQCGHIRAACVYGDPSQRCRSSGSVALPARRIVELARRFDTHERCAERCQTGLVTSVCNDDLSSASALVLASLPRRGALCLDTAPWPRDERGRVSCALYYERLASDPPCDASRGAFSLGDPAIEPRLAIDAPTEASCAIRQIATHPMSHPSRPGAPMTDEPGWFLDERTNLLDPACLRSVRFQGRAIPPAFRRFTIRCEEHSADCGR